MSKKSIALVTLAISISVLFVALPAIGSAAGGSAGKPVAKLCGKKPHNGAFSYYRVHNVGCAQAHRVSRKAGRKFCGHRYRKCSGGHKHVSKGDVSVLNWRCSMRVGFETYRARCHKGHKAHRKDFVHKAGA